MQIFSECKLHKMAKFTSSLVLPLFILHCLSYSVVLGIVKRCYVCKMGCDDPGGYLMSCPNVDAKIWNNDVAIKKCYKYRLHNETVEEYRKHPEKTDVTDYDIKHFALPNEYRNCVYQSTKDKEAAVQDPNEKVKYYDANRTEVCKEREFAKFECIFCGDKDGCNGPGLGSRLTNSWIMKFIPIFASLVV